LILPNKEFVVTNGQTLPYFKILLSIEKNRRHSSNIYHSCSSVIILHTLLLTEEITSLSHQSFKRLLKNIWKLRAPREKKKKHLLLMYTSRKYQELDEGSKSVQKDLKIPQTKEKAQSQKDR
jgi:hypothetical protein